MIDSVASAKTAFPDLTWRGPDPKAQFAFLKQRDGDRSDVVILLVMEDGATAPLHVHNKREGWPFRETISVMVGELHGIFRDYSNILKTGQTVDINDDLPHAPFVPEGGFCLLYYRQPGGSTQVDSLEG